MNVVVVTDDGLVAELQRRARGGHMNVVVVTDDGLVAELRRRPLVEAT